MTTLNELIKFCEQKGYSRVDFEYKNTKGEKTGEKCPRFFTNVDPKDPKNDGEVNLVQFDGGTKPNGKPWSRVLIGMVGSSVRTSYEHLRVTEKGLEWWRRKNDIGITDSTEVLISR